MCGTFCVFCLQLIEGTKGRRHRLVSIVNNMQTAESLKMQSVMLGGEADPSAFMTEVGPFPYDAFRSQEVGSPGRRASREMLPQLSLPQVGLHCMHDVLVSPVTVLHQLWHKQRHTAMQWCTTQQCCGRNHK